MFREISFLNALLKSVPVQNVVPPHFVLLMVRKSLQCKQICNMEIIKTMIHVKRNANNWLGTFAVCLLLFIIVFENQFQYFRIRILIKYILA